MLRVGATAHRKVHLILRTRSGPGRYRFGNGLAVGGKLGVADSGLKPNHAWRHTFKQIADRAGISERMSDYITGHAHRTIGARYGAPTVERMAAGAGEVSEV
jgi:integrase